MTSASPELRWRAGQAVRVRMAELGLTPPQLAKKAGVSANTVRGIVNGQTWPNYETRRRLNQALDWPEGEIGRRALDGDVRLRQFPTIELLRELCRRIEMWDEGPKDAGNLSGSTGPLRIPR